MKSKKLFTLALSAIMVFAMSITAFAATKDDIIKELKNANIDAEYINTVQNFLDNNEVSAAAADTVVAEIKKAAATKGSSVGLADMTQAQKDAILGNIQTAAGAVNATVSIDKVDNVITLTDTTGNVYVAAADPVQPTGVSTYATITVIAGLAITLVACGVVVSKRKFA